MFAVCAFKVAVIVAVWVLFTVPAVAVNVPLLKPVPMVMLPGTLSIPVLLDKPTVAVLNAALFSVTVQVELCPLPSVDGEQFTPDNWAGDTRLKEKLREVPLALAVRVAV